MGEWKVASKEQPILARKMQLLQEEGLTFDEDTGRITSGVNSPWFEGPYKL